MVLTSSWKKRRGLSVTKSEAILSAIRKTDAGSNIILHNNDGSVWCVLRVVCKEHEEQTDENGGKLL